MKRFILSVLVVILLASLVHAFSWSTYTGSSNWDVQVSEDEGECGGSVKTKVVEVTITHAGMTAEVGDWGHGPLRGAFTGNTLVIPDKTIPDSGGSSKLYNIKIVFSPDCLGFSTEYDWFYTSRYQECHGTTTLTGKKAGIQSCPELPKSKKEMLIAARVADAKDQEQKYKDILAVDPNNFWANWDMAELKKKQGNYQDYLNYVAKAATTLDDKTREEVKKEAANSLHITEFPTRDKSPILRIEMDEIQNWNSGMIYNVNYRKPAVDPNAWKTVIRRIFIPDSYNIFNKAAGLPDD